MCGITGYWAKEANLSHDQWKILVEGAFSRGQDGIGIVVINKEGIVFDYKEEGFNKTTDDYNCYKFKNTKHLVEWFNE